MARHVCFAGLDARAASIVMKAVKNTVRTGRTVVCTIHQPSLEIFQAFDELLLLQRGGSTLYCGALGEGSRNLTSYFQKLGAEEMQPGYNPATWMLENTTASVEEKRNVNFAQAFQDSDNKRCALLCVRLMGLTCRWWLPCQHNILDAARCFVTQSAALVSDILVGVICSKANIARSMGIHQHSLTCSTAASLTAELIAVSGWPRTIGHSQQTFVQRKAEKACNCIALQCSVSCCVVPPLCCVLAVTWLQGD